MSDFIPTAEQDAIRAAFATGEDVAVTALAGSGKTSTMQFLAEDRPNQRMTYCAFNKSIATEAQRRFPPWVTCRTVHSLAFQAIGRDYRDRLNGPRVLTWRVADILRLPEVWDFGTVTLRSKQLARLVLDGVSRFCLSADEEPGLRHVPGVPGMEAPEARRALGELLLPYLQRAWVDLTQKQGDLYFSHSVYLKLWAHRDPKLPGEVVLFDEVQDADRVIAFIVAQQRSHQKVYVGDQFQTIYQWKGTADLLSDLDLAPHTLTLCKSFRFGPAIAEEANRILTLLGTDLRVVGHEPVASQLATLERPAAVLTRTNAEAVARLMEAQVAGQRAGLVGGTQQVEALAVAAGRLKEGERTDHPELLAFDNWAQVREHASDDAPDLKVLVALVDAYGADALLAAVRAAVPEEQAQLRISTAHKSKGREFDTVKLASDFPTPISADPVTGAPQFRAEEARLAYVAVTRARRALDSSSLAWVAAVADRLDQVREFPALEEAPVETVTVQVAPTEQVVPDPDDERRLMFRRTPYSVELVAAQRTLPGRRYFGDYCGESKVNVVRATPEALAVAERFGLTVSDLARARVESHPTLPGPPSPGPDS